MSVTNSRIIVSDYLALCARGLTSLKDPSWPTTRKQAAALFDQDPDQFIRSGRDNNLHAFFQAFATPPTLASNRFRDRPVYNNACNVYIPLSDIKPPSREVTDQEIDEASKKLMASYPITIRGIHTPHYQVELFESSYAYYYAALARADTHLLVCIEEKKVSTSVPCQNTKKSKSDFLGDRAALYTDKEFEDIIFRYCKQPELLKDLYELGQINKHPQKKKALLYLDQMIKNAFQINGRPRPASEVVVGIVGYGKDTRLFSVFLNLGYRVITVEDFQDSAHDNGNQESLLNPFQTYRTSNQLQCFDFRSPQLPVDSCDVILSAAIIDPMIDTLLHLTKPGGAIAATEMGQMGTERINYHVDDPSSWSSYAVQKGFRYQERYFDILNGASPLPSDYINPKGVSCYVLQRLE